jgi:hypothetical protein
MGTSESEKVKVLQKEIEELKQNWPAHSVPPALMQQLDELEEALEKALQEDQDRLDEK